MLPKVKDVQYHRFPGTCVTTCCVTFEDDYSVVAFSACARREDYNENSGRSIACARALSIAERVYEARQSEK